MLRKKLTPSCLRRCAVFLAVGGALALNAGRAQGGLALETPSDDQSGLMAPDLGGATQLVTHISAQPSIFERSAVKSTQVAQLADPSSVNGPGLTGENWFQGLQQGVDQSFDAQDQVATPTLSTQKESVSTLDNGVKANAIPSLPSFWSGLTCCLALVIAGMFPRVRRVLR